MNRKYPVVFACDENYAMPFAVTVESLLDNAKNDTFYDVYCLIPEDFSEDCKTRLAKIQKKYKNCSISYINLQGAYSKVERIIPHISFVAYYRFNIPEVLPQYDKVLYLDVDMIIKEDLSNLFETDLIDCYVGSVKHPTLLHRTEVKGYSIPKNSYFNSGMLLMNLEKIRQDKKDAEWIDMIPGKFPIPDQDILNISCAEKVKHLSLRYNMMTRLCNSFEINNAKKVYKDSYDDSVKKPAIIHYADKTKPWDYQNLAFNEDWDKYFIQSCYSDTIDLQNRKNVSYFKVNIKSFIGMIKRFLIRFKIVRYLKNIRDSKF